MLQTTDRVVGAGLATADQTRTNRGLAVMIARAHRWQGLLESGRYASIRELALDVGVDNSYLSYLAPDIVESILNGTEPDGLSLGKLYQAPVTWEEQRRALGRSE